MSGQGADRIGGRTNGWRSSFAAVLLDPRIIRLEDRVGQRRYEFGRRRATGQFASQRGECSGRRQIHDFVINDQWEVVGAGRLVVSRFASGPGSRAANRQFFLVGARLRQSAEWNVLQSAIADDQ